MNVRPPLRLISGMSGAYVRTNRKSRNPQCSGRWFGPDAAALNALRRSASELRWVMKVFEEISDVLPSDAHQMARSSLWHHEIREISDFGQKSWFSWKSQDFFRLESAKPLQTFCTSTALRVSCSLCFWLTNRVEISGKLPKIDQKSIKKGYKIKQISPGIGFLDSHSWGRPQPLQGWF